MRATIPASSGTDSCSSASTAAAARSVEVRQVLLVTCRSARRTAKTVTATCTSDEKNGSQSGVTAACLRSGRLSASVQEEDLPAPTLHQGRGEGTLSALLAVHQLQGHLGPPLAGGRTAGAGAFGVAPLLDPQQRVGPVEVGGRRRRGAERAVRRVAPATLAAGGVLRRTGAVAAGVDDEVGGRRSRGGTLLELPGQRQPVLRARLGGLVVRDVE